MPRRHSSSRGRSGLEPFQPGSKLFHTHDQFYRPAGRRCFFEGSPQSRPVRPTCLAANHFRYRHTNCSHKIESGSNHGHFHADCKVQCGRNIARMLPFSDLALSRRLEGTEGQACAQYAAARRRLFPNSGSEWIECAGTYAVFDGVDSPVTQTFGLGVFAPVTPSVLDTIEKFFLDRGAPVCHEVSPFAGVETLHLLCCRNYRPVELSNVLYKKVENNETEPAPHIQTRIAGSENYNYGPTSVLEDGPASTQSL
jgi:hypothetical protein